MNIKDELLKVYCNRISDFQNIQDVCKGEKIGGPLLVSPGENYIKQPFPFLTIGQETNGWSVFSNIVTEEECKELMFHAEDLAAGGWNIGQFWQVTRKIEKVLGNELYSCAWTNVSKYDQNGDRPDAEHEKIFSAVDDLLIDEIRIIKPKVCLFFVGHHFDSRLENIFPQIEFVEVDGFDIGTLCQLKHPNLPSLTFRTYHPKYLRIKGLEESFIKFIGEQAKK